MARIAGINIPTNKRVEIALTYIHGIGLSSSKKICELANIKDQTRVNNLTEGELSRIRDIIDKDYMVEGDLRRKKSLDINNKNQLAIYHIGLINLAQRKFDEAEKYFLKLLEIRGLA